MNSGEAGIARRAVDIYILQAVSLGAALLTSVLVARALGPEGKGVADLFTFAATLAAEVAVLGTNGGFLYLLANKRLSSAEVHGGALAYASVAGLLGLVVAVSLGQAVSPLLGIPWEYGALAIAIVGPMIYLATWPSLQIGIDRAVHVYRVQLTLGALNAAVVFGLWMAGQLRVDVVIGWTVVWWLCATAVQVLDMARTHWPLRPRPRRQSLRAALGYGLRLYPGGLANWIHFRSDQFVVAAALGPAAVGVYAVSARWAELLLLVGYAISTAGLHRVASSEPVAGHQLTLRLALSVLALTGTAGVILCLIATPLIPILYGADFAPAVGPLVLLVPGLVLWDASRVLSQFVSYNAGRPEIPTLIAVAGAAANLVLALLVIPRAGVAGAAVVSSLTYGAVFAATWLVFARWRHVPGTQ